MMIKYLLEKLDLFARAWVFLFTLSSYTFDTSQGVISTNFGKTGASQLLSDQIRPPPICPLSSNSTSNPDFVGLHISSMMHHHPRSSARLWLLIHRTRQSACATLPRSFLDVGRVRWYYVQVDGSFRVCQCFERSAHHHETIVLDLPPDGVSGRWIGLRGGLLLQEWNEGRCKNSIVGLGTRIVVKGVRYQCRSPGEANV